jgi:Transposase, Mutator family
MADTARMALPEELGKLMEREHADVLRESVELVLRQVMEAEVAALAGAGRYEHSDDRVAYRNGYRPRGSIRGWARSSSRSRAFAPEATSRASSPRAGAPSRHWCRWCRRPTSTASPRERWSAWWSSWASPA